MASQNWLSITQYERGGFERVCKVTFEPVGKRAAASLALSDRYGVAHLTGAGRSFVHKHRFKKAPHTLRNLSPAHQQRRVVIATNLEKLLALVRTPEDRLGV
jgi:hypothetical protein